MQFTIPVVIIRCCGLVHALVMAAHQTEFEAAAKPWVCHNLACPPFAKGSVDGEYESRYYPKSTSPGIAAETRSLVGPHMCRK